MVSLALVHWLDIKRILRYLQGLMNYGLTYNATTISTLDLHLIRDWNNVDWAADIDTRRSTSRYLSQLNSSCELSW